jgi:hypothetical protein
MTIEINIFDIKEEEIISSKSEKQLEYEQIE